MKQNEFIEHLLDLFESCGPVRAKAMFGGFGLYRDDRMFGLVAEDVLYLKADDQSRQDFEARGLQPFTYVRQGRRLAMSYYEAPPEAVDDAEVLCRWAEKAYDVALRSAQGKRKKKK